MHSHSCMPSHASLATYCRTGLACSRRLLPSLLPFANSSSNGRRYFPSPCVFSGKKEITKLLYFRLPEYVFAPPLSLSLPTVDHGERRQRVDRLPPQGVVVASSGRSVGIRARPRFRLLPRQDRLLLLSRPGAMCCGQPWWSSGRDSGGGGGCCASTEDHGRWQGRGRGERRGRPPSSGSSWARHRPCGCRPSLLAPWSVRQLTLAPFHPPLYCFV